MRIPTSIEPGGCVWEYLDNAQIGVVIGNTVYVHGGITADAIGFIPNMQMRYAGVCVERKRERESARENKRECVYRR